MIGRGLKFKISSTMIAAMLLSACPQFAHADGGLPTLGKAEKPINTLNALVGGDYLTAFLVFLPIAVERAFAVKHITKSVSDILGAWAEIRMGKLHRAEFNRLNKAVRDLQVRKPGLFNDLVHQFESYQGKLQELDDHISKLDQLVKVEDLGLRAFSEIAVNQWNKNNDILTLEEWIQTALKPQESRFLPKLLDTKKLLEEADKSGYQREADSDLKHAFRNLFAELPKPVFKDWAPKDLPPLTEALPWPVTNSKLNEETGPPDHWSVMNDLLGKDRLTHERDHAAWLLKNWETPQNYSRLRQWLDEAIRVEKNKNDQWVRHSKSFVLRTARGRRWLETYEKLKEEESDYAKFVTDAANAITSQINTPSVERERYTGINHQTLMGKRAPGHFYTDNGSFRIRAADAKTLVQMRCDQGLAQLVARRLEHHQKGGVWGQLKLASQMAIGIGSIVSIPAAIGYAVHLYNKSSEANGGKDPNQVAAEKERQTRVADARNLQKAITLESELELRRDEISDFLDVVADAFFEPYSGAKGIKLNQELIQRVENYAENHPSKQIDIAEVRKFFTSRKNLTDALVRVIPSISPGLVGQSPSFDDLKAFLKKPLDGDKSPRHKSFLQLLFAQVIDNALPEMDRPVRQGNLVRNEGAYLTIGETIRDELVNRTLPKLTKIKLKVGPGETPKIPLKGLHGDLPNQDKPGLEKIQHVLQASQSEDNGIDLFGDSQFVERELPFHKRKPEPVKSNSDEGI